MENVTETVFSMDPSEGEQCTTTAFDVAKPVGAWHIFYTVAFTLVGAIIIFMNVPTIIVLVQDKSATKSAHILVCNLALSDLFQTPCAVVIWYVRYLDDSLYYVLSIVLSCGCVSINASLFTILAIAVDRYFAVKKPLKYSSAFTNKRATFMCITIWLLCFSICPPLVLIYTFKSDQRDLILFPYLTTIVPRHFLWIFTCLLFTTICLCFVLYQKIYQIVRNSVRDVEQTGQLRSVNNNAATAMAKTMFIVVTFLSLLWTPTVITSFWVTRESLTDSAALRIIYPLMMLVSCISSAINPLIYSLRNKRFKTLFLTATKCASKLSSSCGDDLQK